VLGIVPSALIGVALAILGVLLLLDSHVSAEKD
jgi:hypothetical protein